MFTDSRTCDTGCQSRIDSSCGCPSGRQSGNNSLLPGSMQVGPGGCCTGISPESRGTNAVTACVIGFGCESADSKTSRCVGTGNLAGKCHTTPFAGDSGTRGVCALRGCNMDTRQGVREDEVDGVSNSATCQVDSSRNECIPDSEEETLIGDAEYVRGREDLISRRDLHMLHRCRNTPHQ